ncbi:hypothetical protein MPH_12701 [Macrophomina phaseolina MS6]|uniref:Uncharacterized protein n=1 Tax=Macrophomina phaseolina (strain MS6) TaxID=1126212 RepID=K2RB90_MACPH|nr:hypothetical protein MPH_12701 [Macrophomina phaseolina MS6]
MSSKVSYTVKRAGSGFMDQSQGRTGVVCCVRRIPMMRFLLRLWPFLTEKVDSLQWIQLDAVDFAILRQYLPPEDHVGYSTYLLTRHSRLRPGP